MREWLYQVAIAIDQLANAVLGGMADETISSRSHRLNHRMPHKLYEKVIDLLFWPFQGPKHCENAYKKELAGRHRAPDKRVA